MILRNQKSDTYTVTINAVHVAGADTGMFGGGLITEKNVNYYSL